MKRYNNFTQFLPRRELDPRYGRLQVESYRVTQDFVKRLGLVGELDGHTGCVNCLEWSSDGTLLASGSDDVHVCIWDAFRKRKLARISTGHVGNIFSVKFVPNTGNNHIITGAADNSVRLHDTSNKECLSVCNCHSGRVKRLATDLSTPHLYWSAAEDGLILQHDLRTTHVCATDSKNPKNVLVDLRSYIGSKAEAKCLSLNPIRTELMAVGASDPFIRLYDRRMIKVKYSEEGDGSASEEIPSDGAIQYFVPGHLPTKVAEYRQKYRSLASTYVEFSPDGTELLANLGGEQIYVFPLRRDLQKPYNTFNIPQFLLSAEPAKDQQPLNGYSNGYKNGLSSPERANGNSNSADFINLGKYSGKTPLPKHIERMKVEANEAFEGKKYSRAIQLYNEALYMYPNSAILLGNRGAALLKRAWDGDVYAALRDCYSAYVLDPGHYKVYLRLCRCLYELSRYQEATETLSDFKTKFPMYVSTAAFKRIDEDLTKALKKREASTSPSGSSVNSDHSFLSTTSSSSANTSTAPEPSINVTRNYFLRFANPSSDSSASAQSANEDGSDYMMVSANLTANDDNSQSGTEDAGNGDGAPTPPSEPLAKRVPKFRESEINYQAGATDFTERYCGHCNTTTDIKEANFFGNFIIAGSDDGSFFIWDRKTTNIVKVLKGDESIVNCLQPHPSTCLIASSGIEQVVRLWAPLPEEGATNDRLVMDWNDVASENQKRMNSNPFEVILMHMGYRLNSPSDESDEENRREERPGGVQCNPT